MSYAIPLVYLSDADDAEAAVREANQFADREGIGRIAYVGEPVAFSFDEDAGDPEPDYHVVVEVR